MVVVGVDVDVVAVLVGGGVLAMVVVLRLCSRSSASSS